MKKPTLARLIPLLLVLLAVVLWQHRSGLPPESQRRTTTRLLMGTLVAITTWELPGLREERAVAHAFAEMTRIEAFMSHRDPASAVWAINHAARNQWHPLPAELATMLARGVEGQDRSGAAFDMGLGTLTSLWGFSREPPPAVPPLPAAVAQWLRRRPTEPGIALRREHGHPWQIRLANSEVVLDLGGIAKGYAIDRAVAVLRDAGVVNALVNAGGDLRAIGHKGGTPWRIGIQHPRRPKEVAAVSLLRGDVAMVTSGDYERFFIHKGVRYHHIMGPKQGAPARAGLISVSVQASEALVADILSTAIFVLGKESGLRLLARYPGSEALLITKTGRHYRTPGFQGQWLQQKP